MIIECLSMQGGFLERTVRTRYRVIRELRAVTYHIMPINLLLANASLLVAIATEEGAFRCLPEIPR